MSTRFLKIKIKSLAAESRIIRREEQKLKRPKLKVDYGKTMTDVKRRDYFYTEVSEAKLAKWKKRAAESKTRAVSTIRNLHLHRTGKVREESRATFLAYAFLRNKRYSDTETVKLKNNAIIEPPKSTLRLTASMISRFGDQPLGWTAVQQWIQGDHTLTPK